MASSKTFLNFILEQLSEAEGVSTRSMMGEYLIYVRGILIGGIYDDCFLIKHVEAAAERMPHAGFVQPYEGAAKMLIVDKLDDRLFLKELVEAVAEDIKQSNTGGKR